MMPNPKLIGTVIGMVVTAAACYMALANVASAMSSLVGFTMLRGVRRSLTHAQDKTLSISPMLPGVSLLIDGRGAVEQVFAQIDELMRIPYANFEVIAACEGVCAETVTAFIERYHLLASIRSTGSEMRTGAKSTIFESRTANRLAIVAGENAGAPMNAALAAARMPLVGIVETDSMPTADGLIALMRPFLDNREAPPPASAGFMMLTLATAPDGEPGRRHSGASICAIIDQVRVSTGTVAIDGFGATLPAPGDFVLFDRAALTRSGGFENAGGIESFAAQVMTSYVRLSREARRRGTARTVFIPVVVANRTVPGSVGELSRRRADRARAELSVIRRNFAAVFNPVYGSLGLLALPAMLMGGIFTPGIEVLGYILTALGLGLGVIGTQLAALYLLAAGGFGALGALIQLALALCRPVFAADPIPGAYAIAWTIVDVAGLRQAAAVRALFGVQVASRNRIGGKSGSLDWPGADGESVAAQSVSDRAREENRIHASALRESQPMKNSDASRNVAHAASKGGGLRIQSE